MNSVVGSERLADIHVMSLGLQSSFIDCCQSAGHDNSTGGQRDRVITSLSHIALGHQGVKSKIVTSVVANLALVWRIKC